VGVVGQACGSASCKPARQEWLLKAVEASELQSASPLRLAKTHFSVERTGKPHYATARPRFRLDTFLPIIDVTANDIGRLLASSFSQRSRKLSIETARKRLYPQRNDDQRPLTACMWVQGNPLAVTNLAHLVRLCAEREVEAKVDSSDALVDGTVYWEHGIVAHGFSGGQRVGKNQQERVDVFIPAWTEDVNSLEEKASLHGGSFGFQGGTLDD